MLAPGTGVRAGQEAVAPESRRQAVRRGDPAVAQQRRHRACACSMRSSTTASTSRRAAFTKGEPTSRYVPAFGAHLFLSADTEDVKRVLNDGYAAATIVPSTVGKNESDELRIAFDGDAVLFSDEAERVYQESGLAAFAEERDRSRAAAAVRRAVQGISRRAAPHPERFFRRCKPDPHRAGHRAQRAGARARDPDAARVEHPHRRGVVSRRARQGRVPARVRRRHLLRRPAHARRVGVEARRDRPRAARRGERVAAANRRRASRRSARRTDTADRCSRASTDARA